jgi:hypothetical protein
MSKPKFIDGEDRSRRNPDTFHIPDVADRCSLRIGDHAKVGLESEEGGERFWVKITEVNAKQKGAVYKGTVDSDLVVFDLPIGHELSFEPWHVLGILRHDEEIAA